MDDDVLKNIDQRLCDYKEFITDKFNDQREFVDGRVTGLSGVMRDKFDEAKEQRAEIIEHQKTTNNRVTKLENQTRLIRWAVRKPAIALLLFILLLTGLVIIIDKIGIDAFLRIF